MPKPDLTDEEHAAVVAALRKLIDGDKFPYGSLFVIGMIAMTVLGVAAGIVL